MCKGATYKRKSREGDRGPLGGADRDRGGEIGGSLEDQGAGPLRQEEGDPVDHVRGDVGG